MNRTVLNSTANSGPSVGASSLVTDANSALSGGPHLQRSASINNESYMRLPASPMSFSSNNISISGSSVLDGSSIVQQSSHQDHSSQQMQKRQHGASTASSQPTLRTGQLAFPSGSYVPSSSNQEAHYLSQIQKKPRLDIKQEDVFQQQVMQQLLQRQDSIQLQGHNPQIQALIQQQRLMQRHPQQQQQILQSMQPMQRAQLQQQLQQQQLRQAQQQNLQSVSGVKRPYESGVCARRLMQYIYHQRHRPPDNSIAYWRKFVGEYFAPRAKKRWCLSLYDNVGQHALGFPQATMDAWQCDICNSKAGKGFEATYEVLPRLNKVKFDSGVMDELLYLDMPRECRLPSGVLMLEYGKATQESVFEQLRVIREGHLRIFFTPDLKILSWEFCARRHEEFLPRRLVAPQVNQLLQVAQKYQNAVTESGTNGLSTQDLQTNCNMFLAAGRQLARNMELPLLNDLGFSKRYVRCLQISEVVNSMKDLIDFSRDQNIGPIECLKKYPRQTSKFQMQKMQEIGQQVGNGGGVQVQGLANDQNILNRVMSLHPGMNNPMNNQMVRNGLNANALNSYQNLLRQNSNQEPPQSPFHQGSMPSPHHSQQSMQSPHHSQQSMPSPHHSQQSMPSPHHSQQQPQQGNHHPPQTSSQGNPNVQQHMIQQLLHDMMNNNNNNNNGSGGGRAPQRASSEQNGSNIERMAAVRSNSYKSSSAADSFSLKSSADITQNLHLPEIEGDITNEFPEWEGVL
ncbi:putative transcriptional regulator slk2 [Ranunculus cassubicifolius]